MLPCVANPVTFFRPPRSTFENIERKKTQAGLSRKENCIKAINFHLMVFRIMYSFCSVELLRATQRSGQNRFKLCLTFQNGIYFYPAGLWIYHWFHLQLVYIDMFTLIVNTYSHM